ncbi:rhomboid family intramembrane serine protease [Hymenobacter sp. 15J16-1T3B]|uniref:rhomboid family intramembrane serine protease n=1 Tax=Hymenobacter sp. 15J16-1T3B TaxID=2886941 RepID=UPI001D1231F3|nr:rhomboid family intramembrane serine protease [Hymenobacter sp. 15J16-1T3B]MCC3157526.1 rhomboid family intramembrane serine protease [Hymenobacter sp. 15J16-1T3B]
MEPSSSLADAFARKTDAELLYLTQHPGAFQPALVEAAWAELRRRGQVPAPEPPPRPAPATAVPGLGSVAVTLSLAGLNLLVFLLMVASGVDALQPSGQDLIAWGSNFTPLVARGQWWRLLTACVLHGGVAHLLLNTYALLVIGALLEPLVGRTRLLLAYLLSGLGGSLASLYWHAGWVNSVGASGAIFGLYGAMLTLTATNAARLSRSARAALFVHTLYIVGANFATGLQPGIDHAAHIGGLLAGAVLAWPLSMGMRARG